MKADWVCHVDGQDYGPYAFDQMRQMAAAGQLAPTWHVRRLQDSQWCLASQVPGLFPKPAPQAKAKTAVVTPAGAVPAVVPSAKAIPKGAAVPQGVPAGIPVGAAVSPSAGPPTAAAGVLVGFSVAAGVSPGFAVSTKPKAAVAEEDDDAPTPRRKGGPLATVYILGGVVALLAVAVVGVLIWSANRPGEEEQVAAAEAPLPAVSPELPAANPIPAGNPAPPSNPTLPVAAKNGASPPATVLNAASTGSAQAAIKLVSSWNELDPDPKGPNTLKLKGTTTGVSIKMISAWLASDAHGKPISWKSNPSPASPPSAEATLPASESPAEVPAEGEPAPAAPTPAAAPEPGEIAKFVCAKVRITNTGKSPLNYKGWNAPGPDAAVAIDQSDKVLLLAPLDVKSSLKRSGAVAIQPGDSLDDVLVFAAISPPALPIRLALPHQAVVSASKKAFGFQAAASYLVKDPSGEPPAATVAPPPTAIAGPNAPPPSLPGVLGDSPPAEPAAKGEGEAMPPKPGSPEATAQAAKPKDGAPPSVLDIDKQIQEIEGKGAKPAPK